MALSRKLLLGSAVVLVLIAMVAATEHTKAPKAPPARPTTTVLQEVVQEQSGGFSAMYYGILITFGILWTIYFFLYFFEYGTAGDYYFWSTSYMTLVFLIALGLSKYFTGAILAATLAMTIVFIPITAAGFGAMMSITSPDRFQGDKHNMGRTRLEQGM
jgi:hypothetical protein